MLDYNFNQLALIFQFSSAVDYNLTNELPSFLGDLKG